MTKETEAFREQGMQCTATLGNEPAAGERLTKETEAFREQGMECTATLGNKQAVSERLAKKMEDVHDHAAGGTDDAEAYARARWRHTRGRTGASGRRARSHHRASYE